MRSDWEGRGNDGPFVVRAVAALLLAVVVVLLSARPASAHALLVRSDPASGAVLARSPLSGRLWFDEDITAELSSVVLLDSAGRQVAGTAVTGSADAKVIAVRLPALGAGTYALAWTVLARDDGHTTSGVVVFNVGTGTVTASSAPSGAGTNGAGSLALRWLGVIALVAVVGGLAVAIVVVGRPGGGSSPELTSIVAGVRRRIWALVVVGATIGVLVGLLAGFDQVRRVGGPGELQASVVDVVLGTRWGALWLIREMAFAAVALLAGWRLRTAGAPPPGPVRSPRVADGGAVLLVAALVWVEALGSHAAALESTRWPALLADAGHILAACVWLGALPPLVVMAWPRPTGRRERSLLLRACRGRLTLMLASSVWLLVLTGIYEAGIELSSVGAVWSTRYGRVLLVKSALLVVMGGVGLVNSSRLHERSLGRREDAGRRRPPRVLTRRLVVVEAGVGATLLVAVAVLVGTPPPVGRPQTIGAASEQRRTGAVDDLVVTVSATPNRPGANWFTVLAASSRRPAPARIDSVGLRLAGPQGRRLLSLHPVGPDTYAGVAHLAVPDRMHATVVVHRGGDRLTATVPWPVGSMRASPAVSGRPLAPLTGAVVLVLAACTAAIAWIGVRRRRRGGRPERRTQDPPSRADNPVDDRQLTSR